VISFLSRSMVSLKYFFTMPIVATALVLSVWMTCNGAIKSSSSIFFKTASSSSPASSRIFGLEVKYARAAGYSCGSSGPYFFSALMAPVVSFAEVYDRKISKRRPCCSLTSTVPSWKFERCESSRTFDVSIGIYALVSQVVVKSTKCCIHIISFN